MNPKAFGRLYSRNKSLGKDMQDFILSQSRISEEVLISNRKIVNNVKLSVRLTPSAIFGPNKASSKRLV
jgi:hypothetical protein